MSSEKLIQATRSIFGDPQCGKVFRIKGFIPQGESWLEVNATKDQMNCETIAKGQEIVIVIGEALNQERISSYFK